MHFLLRSDFNYVTKHGLIVDSFLGDFSIEKPLVYKSIADMPPCDLVLFSAKETANDALFPLLEPVLKTGCPVILMQNGISAEEKLAALYPQIHVFGGMCFVCSFRESPGVVRNPSMERVSLAPADATDAGMLHKLAKVFTDAGIDVETLENLGLARWRKLMWNIPYNGLTAVMNCKTDFLVGDPAMRELVAEIMKEIARAAAACGYVIEDGFAEKMVRDTERMKPYEPSLKLDFLAGRPMEIDAIYSNPIRFAAQRGFVMHYTNAIRLALTALEHKRQRPETH